MTGRRVSDNRPRRRGRAQAPASRGRSPHGIAALSAHHSSNRLRFYRDRKPSARSSTRIRATSSAPKAAQASAPVTGAWRAAQTPGARRRRRHSWDAGGRDKDRQASAESRAEPAHGTSSDRRASQSPSTSAPSPRQRPGLQPSRRRPANLRGPVLQNHREKTRRIDDPHRAVHVIRRLNRPGGAQPPLVDRRSPRLEQHGDEGEGEEDGGRQVLVHGSGFGVRGSGSGFWVRGSGFNVRSSSDFFTIDETSNPELKSEP